MGCMAANTIASIISSAARTRIAPGNDVFIQSSGKNANKAVRFTFTFGATADGKYKAGTANVVTYWRTR